MTSKTTPDTRMVSVPVEPTEAMLKAGLEEELAWSGEPVDCLIEAWRVMLAAAPAQSAKTGELEMKAAFLWGFAKGSGAGLSAGNEEWRVYWREIKRAQPQAREEAGAVGWISPETISGLSRGENGFVWPERLPMRADIAIYAAPPSPDADKLRAFDVEAYVEDYEFRGDEGDYTPTEDERGLLIDAIHGVIAAIQEGRK